MSARSRVSRPRALPTSALPALLLALAAGPALAQDAGWRTVEFETAEATDADVAASPDGRSLVMSILGHLYLLPVEGGAARQLTTGPHFDSEPVFSPDGSRIAFVSDRDGGGSDIFVLDPATGEIARVTREDHVAHPVWTPAGDAIAYLSFPRTFAGRAPARVRRVRLPDGRAKTVHESDLDLRSLFHLADGRLAWVAFTREEGGREVTRIQTLDAAGAIVPVRTFDGAVNRVVASPAGDGVYAHGWRSVGGQLLERLVHLPLPDGPERVLTPARSRKGYWSYQRFGLSPDGRTLYLVDAGRLWAVSTGDGARVQVPFSARIARPVRDPLPPPAFRPPPTSGSFRPRSVLSPALSPDARTLVFGAAGRLWTQRLDGGPAERLLEDDGYQREPAFSPDGARIAFVREADGVKSLVIKPTGGGALATIASGEQYRDPAWSPDGRRLAYQAGNRIVLAELETGTRTAVGPRVAAFWPARPHFSADGRAILYTARDGDLGRVLRLELGGDSAPRPATALSDHASDAVASPDGRWLAFRRNLELWVAPLGAEPATERDARLLSADAGGGFSFTADGAALVYAAAGRVWRQPVTGGAPEELPVRLELERATASPLLIRRVRVLDFEAGGFGPEQSVYVEDGRIRWIGAEPDRPPPPGVAVLDAGGRFAIPGLFEFHTHIEAEADLAGRAFLAYGVTSVRSPADRLEWWTALGERAESSGDPLPRHFGSGEMLEGADPLFGNTGLLVDDSASAAAYVRRQRERGASFIKSYVSLPWRLHRVVADEARRQGLPLAAHGRSVEEIVKGVTLGYSVLEHFYRRGRAYDDVLRLLAAAGTRWDPTLAIGRGVQVLLLDEPRLFDDDPKIRAFAAWLPRPSPRIEPWSARGEMDELLQGVRAAHRLGVPLHVGTDASIGRGGYGFPLHWEMRLLARVLPPLEVLRLASAEAAAAVGAADHLGTIQPGRLADLVLLDADPLADIRNAAAVWRVVKGGWVHDPEALRP